MERLLTVGQVAAILAISERTVFRLAADGELPGLKIRQCLRFTEDAVERFQQKQIQKWIFENGIAEGE